jgi:hypothetical protein
VIAGLPSTAPRSCTKVQWIARPPLRILMRFSNDPHAAALLLAACAIQRRNFRYGWEGSNG